VLLSGQPVAVLDSPLLRRLNAHAATGFATLLATPIRGSAWP
jgi:hypothetical protein